MIVSTSNTCRKPIKHRSSFILDKIRKCVGPDKTITEKTVADCLVRLNERVDELLMVKAYFDYRKAMEEHHPGGAFNQAKDSEVNG